MQTSLLDDRLLQLTLWIRGSGLAWTDAYVQQIKYYGNFRGHSEKWCWLFIRKRNVLGVVKKELIKSIIKQCYLQRLAKERLAVTESSEKFIVSVNTLHDLMNTEAVSCSSSCSM